MEQEYLSDSCQVLDYNLLASYSLLLQHPNDDLAVMGSNPSSRKPKMLYWFLGQVGDDQQVTGKVSVIIERDVKTLVNYKLRR